MAKRPMPTFDPSDEWFRRPDVWSGLVLGAWAATRSFGPSLMPRATAHQAMVSGAAAAIPMARVRAGKSRESREALPEECC